MQIKTALLLFIYTLIVIALTVSISSFVRKTPTIDAGNAQPAFKDIVGGPAVLPSFDDNEQMMPSTAPLEKQEAPVILKRSSEDDASTPFQDPPAEPTFKSDEERMFGPTFNTTRECRTATGPADKSGGSESTPHLAKREFERTRSMPDFTERSDFLESAFPSIKKYKQNRSAFSSANGSSESETPASQVHLLRKPGSMSGSANGSSESKAPASQANVLEHAYNESDNEKVVGPAQPLKEHGKSASIQKAISKYENPSGMAYYRMPTNDSNRFFCKILIGIYDQLANKESRIRKAFDQLASSAKDSAQEMNMMRSSTNLERLEYLIGQVQEILGRVPLASMLTKKEFGLLEEGIKHIIINYINEERHACKEALAEYINMDDSTWFGAFIEASLQEDVAKYMLHIETLALIKFLNLKVIDIKIAGNRKCKDLIALAWRQLRRGKKISQNSVEPYSIYNITDKDSACDPIIVFRQ